MAGACGCHDGESHVQRQRLHACPTKLRQNVSCIDPACMLCYSLAAVASQCNTSRLLAQGATPLLLAAVKGDIDLAYELLSNKADAYAVDPWVRHKRFMSA